MQKIIAFIVFAVLVIAGLSSSDSPKSNAEMSADVLISPTSTGVATETSTKESEKILYKVVKVTDGDTIQVEIDGKTESIRMIGMDTPETVDPRKPVQCFGKEASDKAKELLGGKNVSLESDPTAGDRDRYNRLLRYVFTEDGANFGKLMISEGYAHEYTYNLPYKYQDEFKQAAREAREAGRGLWSADSCGGDTTMAAGGGAAVGQASGSASPVAQSPKSAESTATIKPNSVEEASTVEQAVSSGVVKKSNSDICHAPGTTYYGRTIHFTAFETIGGCLESGGRLPER